MIRPIESEVKQVLSKEAFLRNIHTARRSLAFEDLEGSPSAKECPNDIHLLNSLEEIQRKIFNQRRGRPDSGVLSNSHGAR
jgi:hypothetical protein